MADIAAAKRLYQHATELMADGQFAEATVHLEAALRIKETAGLRFNLAFCLAQMGRVVVAMEMYRQASELAESTGAYDVAELVGPAIKALEPRIAVLHIEYPPELKAAQLRVDGAPLALTRELTLDPGLHEISVQAKGRQTFHRKVHLTEGEHSKLAVTLPFLLPARRAPPVSAAPQASPNPIRTGILVSEGIFTLTSLALGIAFTVNRAQSQQQFHQTNDRVTLWDGSASACHSPEGALRQLCQQLAADIDAKDRARTLQGYALAATGFGAVATLATALLWPEIHPRTESRGGLEINILPSGDRGATAALNGQF